MGHGQGDQCVNVKFFLKLHTLPRFTSPKMVRHQICKDPVLDVIREALGYESAYLL